jgi:ribosome-interacting GTPase 1
MDSIFKKERGIFVYQYLDDIVIFSKNISDHKKHLEIIFGKLKSAGIKLNKKKSKLYRSEIKLLGYIIKKGIVYLDPEKIKGFKTAKYQKTLNNSDLF